MVRHLILVLATCVICAWCPVLAQAAQFRWQTGDVLVYRVEQTTIATATSGDNKTETKTKLNLTKRWEVKSVTKAGVATLHMSLTRLRLENTRPDGEALLFDSANADKSNPQMAKELAGYVGKPLAILRMDDRGQVVDVKESKFGGASRFENELPFAITLPESGPKEGQKWQRSYQITLEPPQGTGEKFNAIQNYACKSLSGNLATVALQTEVKNPPENVADQEPLLQFQPQGEVVFDVRLGRMQSARLVIDKELKGAQGASSSYRLQSTYTEEFVGDK
ncbi:MAG: hypothetical protein ACJ8FY_27770 [Gemmataceae bacterium]